MEFIPNNDTLVANSPEREDSREIPLPKIGDTMKILVTNWGYEVLGSQSYIRSGQKIIEVEVKAFKESKLVLE